VLSKLAFGKRARVVVVDRDRYGRSVGRVYVGDMDVNAEMVRRGAAWVCRRQNGCRRGSGGGESNSGAMEAVNELKVKKTRNRNFLLECPRYAKPILFRIFR
jgi:endonuclease YncB( thermonuclease family)